MNTDLQMNSRFICKSVHAFGIKDLLSVHSAVFIREPLKTHEQNTDNTDATDFH